MEENIISLEELRKDYSFGKFLKFIRQQNGLTKEEVYKWTCIPVDTLREIESDKHIPNDCEADMLSNFYVINRHFFDLPYVRWRSVCDYNGKWKSIYDNK